MNRDLGWAREQLASLLRFNVDEADEAFAGTAANPWSTIDGFLNEAYNLVIVHARNVVNPELFIVLKTLPWTSSALTLQLPAHLSASSIFSIEDITGGDPGYPITVARNEAPAGYTPVRFLDYRTLQWGSEGPGEDKTLRIRALGRAEVLTNEQEEPVPCPL